MTLGDLEFFIGSINFVQQSNVLDNIGWNAFQIVINILENGSVVSQRTSDIQECSMEGFIDIQKPVEVRCEGQWQYEVYVVLKLLDDDGTPSNVGACLIVEKSCDYAFEDELTKGDSDGYVFDVTLKKQGQSIIIGTIEMTIFYFVNEKAFQYIADILSTNMNSSTLVNDDNDDKSPFPDEPNVESTDEDNLNLLDTHGDISPLSYHLLHISQATSELLSSLSSQQPPSMYKMTFFKCGTALLKWIRQHLAELCDDNLLSKRLNDFYGCSVHISTGSPTSALKQRHHMLSPAPSQANPHGSEPYSTVPYSTSYSTQLVTPSKTNSAVVNPDHVESSQILALTKAFLVDICDNHPQGLLLFPTMMMVEKQWRLFLTVDKHADEAPHHTAVSALSDQSDDQKYTWETTLLFLRITCVWYLQDMCNTLKQLITINHAITIQLHAKDNTDNGDNDENVGLELAEIFSLRTKFDVYDMVLDGTIQTDDVSYILEDMGGNYSEDELSLILDILDPDNLGSVTFNTFIGWWCNDL